MSKQEEKKDIIKKIKRRHGWKLVSLVLFALFLASVFTGGFRDFGKSGGIGSQTAATQAVEFINTNLLAGRATAELKNVKEEAGLYVLRLRIEGQEFESYITKDGKYLFPQGVDLTEEAESPTPTQQSPSIQKSNKPVAEAFVFSYCPYGLQFQKALLPVYELLKNKADIELVAIGAMHGEYEKQESLRQVCIQEKYSKDKLWDYLEKFMADNKIGNCRGDMACSDPLVEQIMTQIGIDKGMINDCMATDAGSLYTLQNSQASGLGISGSPAFVVNGVKIQVGRSPEAIKEVICSAFNNPPEECQQTLSTTQASPGFGTGTSTSSGSC